MPPLFLRCAPWACSGRPVCWLTHATCSGAPVARTMRSCSFGMFSKCCFASRELVACTLRLCQVWCSERLQRKAMSGTGDSVNTSVLLLQLVLISSQIRRDG